MSMRPFKEIESKFKLRLQVFYHRIWRRGKPRPVSLLTLPNELLQEVAYFLCKRDQKAFRSICRRVDLALRTTVLSAVLINITLPFSNRDQDILRCTARQPAGCIHRLRICLWGSHAERHAPTKWDVAEGGNPNNGPHLSRSRLEMKADSKAFRCLYKRAFASMSNLRAFTLCVNNGARKAPSFFFEDTFNSLMKLPTIDLHLTHPEFTLPYFSHLSQFHNICKFSLIGYENNSTRTIERTLACVLMNNDRLSDLSLHLMDRWDRRRTSVVISGLERFFPKETDLAIALRHLSLSQGRIIAAPHILHHLHRLQSLEISNFDLCDTPIGFWVELARQGIYIPSIIIKSHGVPSAVIDYLVSNEGMVELTFEVETDRGNVSKRVLSEVVPRHSRTLEVLQLTSCWGSHWIIGRLLQEHVVGVSNCSKLRVLGIVVEGNKDFTDPMLFLLNALSNLQTLRLVAHTPDFTPVIKCIKHIRDNERLLMRLQVVVSVSYLRCIKFGAGRLGWDLDDEEVDVLRDDLWHLDA